MGKKGYGDNRNNFAQADIEELWQTPGGFAWKHRVKVIEVVGVAPMRLALVNIDGTSGLARVQVPNNVNVGDKIRVKQYIFTSRLLRGMPLPQTVWYIGKK